MIPRKQKAEMSRFSTFHANFRGSFGGFGFRSPVASEKTSSEIAGALQRVAVAKPETSAVATVEVKKSSLSVAQSKTKSTQELFKTVGFTKRQELETGASEKAVETSK